MRIGIDASMLTNMYFGIGHYVNSLLLNMVEMEPDIEFVLYANASLSGGLKSDNVDQRIVPSKNSQVWRQTTLPKRLAKDNLDLFWGGNYALPLHPKNIKKVVTIHDFVFKRYPKTLPFKTVLHLNLALPYYLRSTNHVLVDSQNTAFDLNEFYRYPRDQITVIPLAARSEFLVKLEDEVVDSVLDSYSLKRGYVLFVGTIEPRKGLETIIEALAIYRKRNNYCPHLVIVGKIGWKSGKIISLVDNLRLTDSVYFLDYIADTDLPAVYQGASLFVYPSLYEGFGLPVLEAMASGVPVITSNSSSLPEVGGEAVLYTEPGDTEKLSELMDKVLENRDLQLELKAKGLAQAQRFSWQRTAQETLDVFKRVVMSG